MRRHDDRRPRLSLSASFVLPFGRFGFSGPVDRRQGFPLNSRRPQLAVAVQDPPIIQREWARREWWGTLPWRMR